MLPCIKVNKLLIDVRQLYFEIPLICLLIEICQALKDKNIFLIQFLIAGPGQRGSKICNILNTN